MALAPSRARGGPRGPGGNESTPPAPPPRGPRTTQAAASSLRDSLQQLYALKPTRQVFAEEAVKMLAKGAGAVAAALFNFESRHERLRLVAVTGLEPDAVLAL